ncbi:hypothetical protein BV372_24160 [Nostoc sp. T09]|uniref:HMA2 domain-containing protein n=1 Tax=Nostoc sp. T09 TaxID=1932621 RepID=UPI000A39AD83|nr:hypothetical protein [Nostoc sp. T09]OUL28960.1 hypothetical protein BV372_24160 [Nostoc sp. T09]
MKGATSQMGAYPSEKSIDTNNHAAREFYSITYALPGEVGFCIPRITEDLNYLQCLLEVIEAEPWVVSQQVNYTAGSIVITYKPGVISDVEMRSHFADLLQSARDTEVVTKQTANYHHQSQPDSETLPTEQYPKVAYTIAHAIPGRVRFHVPRIASDPQYAQSLEALLKADPAVTSERVNRNAASIVITYKTVKDSQKRMQNIWETIVSHLANLIQSASDRAMTNKHASSRI